MAGGEPNLAQLIFEPLQFDSGLNDGLHVVGVYADDPVQFEHIDDDSQVFPILQPALGGGFTRTGNHVDAILAAEPENLGHFGAGIRVDDRQGRRYVENPAGLGELLVAVRGGVVEGFGIGFDPLQRDYVGYLPEYFRSFHGGIAPGRMGLNRILRPFFSQVKENFIIFTH